MNTENDNKKDRNLPISDVNHNIFLIEKGWIDPMENRNADGYKPYKYLNSEKEAREFCKKQGFWTPNDCWSIEYGYENNKMMKYKFIEIPYCD